jgi:branched-chain amino acid transport system substrate-binding protein
MRPAYSAAPIVLGLALGAGIAGGAAADTIRVGIVLPYSGVNADLGTQMDRAFDLYLKTHAGDIAPHRIELVKRDEGPGSTAKTVVTELITRDKVKLIAGFALSPSAIAAAPVATQAKVPMLISNAGTAWITQLSPYIVRFSFSMWHQAYPMGGYAADKLGCKTVAMGYTDYPPGKDATEAFRTGFEKAGGKIADVIPMGNPAQVPDFTPFLQRVKDAKPDCFYVFVPSGAHSAGLVKSFGEVGLRAAGVRLVATTDVVPDNKLQDMGDAVLGAVVMGAYAADLDNAANKAFVADWTAAYGADAPPDFMSAAAYDAMAAIFHAVKALDGHLDDGAKVVDTLKGWSHQSPRGDIAIDPATRDIIQDERAMEIVRRPDGRLGTKILGVVAKVRDECKELKIGRCGQPVN